MFLEGTLAVIGTDGGNIVEAGRCGTGGEDLGAGNRGCGCGSEQGRRRNHDRGCRGRCGRCLPWCGDRGRVGCCRRRQDSSYGYRGNRGCLN